MAKDGTSQVGQGQTGSDNPFSAGSQSTAMTVSGFSARLGNQEIGFRSEADYLKVNAYIQQLQSNNSSIPQLGSSVTSGMGMGMGSNTGQWIQQGANAMQGISNYFQGRNLRQRLRDIQDSQDEQDRARQELMGLQSKYPELIPTLLRALDAERRSTEAQAVLIEDEIGWVDLQTGASVANFFGSYLTNNSSQGVGGFLGNGVGIAAVGLGVGWMLTRDSSNNSDRRRR